jgi:Electron transfer DM13
MVLTFMFTCLLINVLQNYVDLGKLKANNGNQNYNIPAGTDIRKHNIVLIWCKDFSVLFGNAALMV